jgi:hypothetical protein
MEYTIDGFPLTECSIDMLKQERFYGYLHGAPERSPADRARMEAIEVEIVRLEQKLTPP